jgi:tetratricopeptide (TPR) repeat protein
VRLGVLLGILLLVVCAMAYWYWRASNSPGAGANLPGVPMPLTDAPGTASNAGPMVIVPPASNAPVPEQFTEAPAQAQNEIRQGASAAEQQAMIQSAVQQAVAAQLAQMPPPAPPALPPVMAPNNQQIQVVRNDTAPQINPGVQQGYQALASGQLGTARQQYEAVLQQDPVNRDALLGLAAVAQQGNQGAQAAALYLRLLEINPDDGVALAGLIGLRQGDLVQSESRLKAILERTPESGPVLFALGNVYAQQRRWPEAQQQFFRAYSAVPGNADYAYNLAIGLDRLNQPKLAATYYQRALTLAQTSPSAFDRAAAQQRLGELGAPASSATPGIVIIKE